MNVLIIGTTDKRGGAAKVSWDIKEALEQAGHEVTMYVADKYSNDPKVKVIPRSAWRKYVGLALATETFIDTDWMLETPEFKLADLVHCHNLHGRYFNLETLQKMSTLKPVVWTLHDEWAVTTHCAYTLEGTDMRHGLFTCPSLDTQPRILWDNTANLAKLRIQQYADSKLHIITPSKWLLNRVNQTVLKVQDVRLIANGINTSVFTKTPRSEAREKLKLPQDKKIILFLATAGKANTWKGWQYTEAAIEHYKSDPSVLFLNVGNFTKEESAETNVEYRLHVDSKEELALYYSAADMLLFTSIADNFPLVILEAMSCGLPIVSFAVGGVPEVLTHLENGFIADYKNTEHLITGIDWVNSLNSMERAALEEQSMTKIKGHYTTQCMKDAYIMLYKELLPNL